jgi:hypothetical protein
MDEVLKIVAKHHGYDYRDGCKVLKGDGYINILENYGVVTERQSTLLNVEEKSSYYASP